MTGVSESRCSAGDLDGISEWPEEGGKEMEGEVVRNASVPSTSSRSCGYCCSHMAADSERVKQNNTGS